MPNQIFEKQVASAGLPLESNYDWLWLTHHLISSHVPVLRECVLLKVKLLLSNEKPQPLATIRLHYYGCQKTFRTRAYDFDPR